MEKVGQRWNFPEPFLMPAIDHKLLKFQQLKASLSIINFTIDGPLLRAANRCGKLLESGQFWLQGKGSKTQKNVAPRTFWEGLLCDRFGQIIFRLK